jgi:hypothetical protein
MLMCALASARHTSGSTHNFYLYPARFSPEIAKAVIEKFSEPNDWVLDPFMGGGTSIVEGLMLGRRMIGADLNSLAHFVTSVRTKPLSRSDEECLCRWATNVARKREIDGGELEQIANLPRRMKAFLAKSVGAAECLRFPRQQAFARCVLLRLGQWALDCRDVVAPSRSRLAWKLTELTDDMIIGLRELVDRCGNAGVAKSEIAGRRILLWGDARELAQNLPFNAPKARPRLVFTSPPYPRVHVLYHRWQVRGRRETPAPYWIAQVPDGYFQSHYTGGSRTPTGERRYFSMIRSVFSTLRPRLAPDSLVVQLVGFADVDTQLPQYLTTMREAGYEEWIGPRADQQRLWRHVPNRKWHAKLQHTRDASCELLLFHRPTKRR